MMTTNTHNAESHVDRAMRGPTPDNPSLSLKKRLKRAAFFDQRDREVAQGKAEPVDADAGLPEAMAEDGFMLQPDDHSDGLDFSQVFQGNDRVDLGGSVFFGHREFLARARWLPSTLASDSPMV